MTDVLEFVARGRYKASLRAWNAVPAGRDHTHYNNGSLLNLLLSDYEGARRCIENSIAVGPTVRGTYHEEEIVLILWLAGQRSEAIVRQRKLVLELDRGEFEYSSDPWGLNPRLRLAALFTLTGKIDLAIDVIDAARRVAEKSPAQELPNALVPLLAGQLDEFSVFDKARLGSDGSPRGDKAANRSLCVAEFYSGIFYLMGARPQKARVLFGKATKRHVFIEKEWFLARGLVRDKSGVGDRHG